jgi:hypothetical protein
MSLAWQTLWGIPADSTATARTINAEAGSAGPIGTQRPEERTLMGRNGAAIDPISGPHDVSGTWSLPLCAVQGGLWLRGLMGDVASVAAVGSRGGFLFRTQPVGGDTITIGSVTITFTTDAASTNEVQIGATLIATVAAVATAAAALSDLGATARGQAVWIEHDTADDTGDTIVTASSAPMRITPYSATLKGGGNRKHVWKSEENAARPYATIEVDHTDSAGSYRFRLVDGQMVRSISIAKNRSGQATMTADVLARLDQRSSARTLDGSPTTLAVSAFSFTGGSIVIGGICVGTIDSASITMGVDLTTDGFDACGVDGPGLIGKPIVGDTTGAFSLTGRFPLGALHDAAFAETPVAIALDYVNSRTGEALFISLPRVFLGRPSETYQGRGIITADFSGVAQIDASSGARYACTLYSPTADFS